MQNDTETNMIREQIGAYDAKTKLPEILRNVETGKNYTITNRGKPVADLIPSHASHKARTQTAINNLLKMRKHTVSDAELERMKLAGRK